MCVFIYLPGCGLLRLENMKMKIVAIVLLLSLPMMCRSEEKDSLLVMFWNLENFFDYMSRGESESDEEFSSFGNRHWTKARFEAKCNAVAKTIYWISDRYGRIPDVIGVAEVENRTVLSRLVRNTSLKKTDYDYIHFEGRDRRGIDVALLYRKSLFEVVSVTRKVPVTETGDTLQTRDVLHVALKRKKSTEASAVDFVVNHHPSKYGGSQESEPRRKAAMTALRQLCDSLSSSCPDNVIIAMGDFNDTPDSDTFAIIEGLLTNKAGPLHDDGKGTIRYEGKWDMIDMFLLSPELDAVSEMEVVKVPFLMVRDNKHSGEKPFRTYSGPRYIGGVSDHCPIVLKLCRYIM